MIGQTVGKYRVLDRVGRGGMGTVYRAVDETLHREVAIKVLNAELDDPDVARRFRTEAITVARLSHPGIATIYELFEQDGRLLMVMEFVRGRTLEQRVVETGPLVPEQAATLCMQSLTALGHAHGMGVVHRDLKPANIMVTDAGAVKVMDFGIARVAGGEHLTSAGFMMGTPAYMAPEQVLGQDIDGRADLYAMGVVLYRLVTARLPFKGETPFALAQAQVNAPPLPAAALRADLPEWVDSVLTRALTKAPEDRFQTAAEFYEALEASLAGSGTAASLPTLMMTPPRPLPGHATGHQRSTTSTEAALEQRAEVLQPSGETEATVADLAIEGASAAPAPVRRLRAGAVAAASGVLIAAISTGGFLLYRITGHPAQPEATAFTPSNRSDGTAAPLPGVGVSAAAEDVVLLPPPPTSSMSETAEGVRSARDSGAAAGTIGGPDRAAGPDAGRNRAGQSATPRGGPLSPSSAAGRSAGGATAVADPVEVFPDTKLTLVRGRDTDTEDVELSFGNGEVSLRARNGLAPLAAMPYDGLRRATYVQGRDPKWDPAWFSPPDNLDVGGPFRSSKHWLVLQGSSAFLILQLPANRMHRVMEVIESRTGVSVSRPVQQKR
jgi:serine/threonine-protein kinase